MSEHEDHDGHTGYLGPTDPPEPLTPEREARLRELCSVELPAGEWDDYMVFHGAVPALLAELDRLRTLVNDITREVRGDAPDSYRDLDRLPAEIARQNEEAMDAADYVGTVYGLVHQLRGIPEETHPGTWLEQWVDEARRRLLTVERERDRLRAELADSERRFADAVTDPRRPASDE